MCKQAIHTFIVHTVCGYHFTLNKYSQLFLFRELAHLPLFCVGIIKCASFPHARFDCVFPGFLFGDMFYVRSNQFYAKPILHQLVLHTCDYTKEIMLLIKHWFISRKQDLIKVARQQFLGFIGISFHGMLRNNTNFSLHKKG